MLCIASYTAAVCVKNKGIPYSISETFYKLEHKAWFGISMLLTAALLMPPFSCLPFWMQHRQVISLQRSLHA